MVASSTLLHLALLPALALGSSVVAGGKATSFYDSVSLREVGARNTLVGSLPRLRSLTYTTRIGASG